jgi:hypothetical protein
MPRRFFRDLVAAWGVKGAGIKTRYLQHTIRNIGAAYALKIHTERA